MFVSLNILKNISSKVLRLTSMFTSRLSSNTLTLCMVSGAKRQKSPSSISILSFPTS